MTNTKILALAPNAWHDTWMNRQQLLSRLASSHQILYSNGALSVWDRNKPHWASAPWLPGFTTSDGVILDVGGRLPPRWPRKPFFDSAVVRFHAIRWLRRLVVGKGQQLVLYLFHPMFWPYVRHIPASRLVYHAYDVFEQYPNWTKELDTAQQQLLRQADLVIASSAVIASRLQSLGKRTVEVIPNGVDFQLFNACPASAPEDIRSIPRPRLGYVGRVNRKIDLRLLDELASERPDRSLVIVGPISNLDEETRAALKSLRERDNVYLLGTKPHRELPGYMHSLDVALLPYRIGKHVWTEGIYPLKLHEYLAAGLPVVASDIPSLHEFKDVISIIPSNLSSWLTATDTALVNNVESSKTKRISTARQNDWNIRTAQLRELLYTL